MSTEIYAEMNASVWKITAEVGDVLEIDGEVMILESMKMEIPVEVEEAGTLAAIHVSEGQSVTEGQLLATIE